MKIQIEAPDNVNYHDLTQSLLRTLTIRNQAIVRQQEDGKHEDQQLVNFDKSEKGKKGLPIKILITDDDDTRPTEGVQLAPQAPPRRTSRGQSKSQKKSPII